MKSKSKLTTESIDRYVTLAKKHGAYKAREMMRQKDIIPTPKVQKQYPIPKVPVDYYKDEK